MLLDTAPLARHNSAHTPCPIGRSCVPNAEGQWNFLVKRNEPHGAEGRTEPGDCPRVQFCGTCSLCHCFSVVMVVGQDLAVRGRKQLLPSAVTGTYRSSGCGSLTRP